MLFLPVEKGGGYPYPLPEIDRSVDGRTTSLAISIRTATNGNAEGIL